jgi:hypothetical protein
MAGKRKNKQAIIDWLMQKDTPKNCIAAKCVDCIYDELAEGTWRQQVEACTCADSCQLYQHRPLAVKVEVLKAA